jgi:hypothetical protein
MMAFPRTLTLEGLIKILPDKHQAKSEYEALKRRAEEVEAAKRLLKSLWHNKESATWCFEMASTIDSALQE